MPVPVSVIVTRGGVSKVPRFQGSVGEVRANGPPDSTFRCRSLASFCPLPPIPAPSDRLELVQNNYSTNLRPISRQKWPRCRDQPLRRSAVFFGWSRAPGFEFSKSSTRAIAPRESHHTTNTNRLQMEVYLKSQESFDEMPQPPTRPLHALVLYLTWHGNSKLVAERIRDRLIKRWPEGSTVAVRDFIEDYGGGSDWSTPW